MNGRLRLVNLPLGDLEIDPGVGGKDELEIAPPLESVSPEQPPEPRHDHAQVRIGSRRRVVRPEDAGELVASDRPHPIAGQVNEQQPSLPARKTKHIGADHPDLVGRVTSEDLLAMAEEA